MLKTILPCGFAQFSSRAAGLVTACAVALLMSFTSDGHANGCVSSDAVAYYPGDGNTSDVARGNNGTFMGTSQYADGVVDKAFFLNGTDSFIQAPSSTEVDPLSSGTQAAWVYFDQTPSAAGHHMVIISKGDIVRDFDLQAQTDDLFHFYIGVGLSDEWHVQSTTVIQPGVWYHVVGTWEAGVGIRLYVNGKLEADHFTTVGRGPSGQPLQIGNSFVFGPRLFKGKIDDVMIFNRLVTSNEVLALYSYGITGNCTPYTVVLDDVFATGTLGWTQFGPTRSDQTTSYDTTHSALLANITESQAGYRIIGWLSPPTDTVYYGAVGTNIIRAKYYVFASGQTNSATNSIPNFRCRIANRFAVSSILQVANHLNADPEATNLAQDIRPSTGPASPSLYRVDLDPIDVPQLVNHPGTEGFLRLIEAYEPETQAHGSIGMTECQLGVYPALPDSSTLVDVTSNGLIKTYRAEDGDFGNGDIGSSNSSITIAKYFNGSPETTGPLPTVSISEAGVTLETLSVPTDRFSAAALDVFNKPSELIANHYLRARVEPGKQYKFRFHATATKNTNTQSTMRFRARTIKFQYTNALEIGGSHGASVANNTLAQQALPGVGNQIPAVDRISPGENGGWYNVIMVTPMNPDIQADQPTLYAQDPPGVDTQPGNNSKSRRDLQFGFDVIDTFTTGAGFELEAGQMTVDRVDIMKYNLQPD
uniref:Cell wall/surface repeat protein n=1 Tax=uncultured bacterium AOCefta2 TaxID=654977 RepID=D6MLX5_9BACT|nr:cell wall/surface repeat protein [uncultured bacterium AOCefta2]